MSSLFFRLFLLSLSWIFFTSPLRAEVPEEIVISWSQPIPEQIYKDYVESNCFLSEKQEPWRETLKPMFTPQLKDCKNEEEAVLKIASKIGDITGVYYTVERRTAVMSAMEALREKKVSCSGNSILLASALRSVGIPARLVGIASWAHVRGNHTWCEAWVKGEWKMIEFNSTEFNTPWVMENVLLLDAKKNPIQRILAASGGNHPCFSIDRSDHYAGLAKSWQNKQGLDISDKRLCIEVLSHSTKKRCVVNVALYNEKGILIQKGKSPSSEADMRQFLDFNVTKGSRYTLQLQALSGGAKISHEIPVSDDFAQIISLSMEME